jgi:branched-chain amino acid aminotransferase
MAMDETLFSLNGRIVPEAQAVVPVTDRGFLYGDGLFETIHAYGRTPFRLREHLARMATGFRAMAFKPAPSAARLTRWIVAAIHKADFPEANIRLTVTRGSGPRGPSIKGPYRPTIVVTVSRFHRRPEKHYTKGVSAIIAGFRRQESSIIANLKTTAYIEQIFARREADDTGADEALLLNNAGLLCEGSSSNISLVKDGTLCVPDPKLAGALPGTAQLVAIELAEKLRIPVCRTALGPWDLRECDEAFLSGSLRELTPLAQVDGRPVGNGRPGPITRKVIAAYRMLVQRECPGYRFP